MSLSSCFAVLCPVLGTQSGQLATLSAGNLGQCSLMQALLLGSDDGTTAATGLAAVPGSHVKGLGSNPEGGCSVA